MSEFLTLVIVKGPTFTPHPCDPSFDPHTPYPNFKQGKPLSSFVRVLLREMLSEFPQICVLSFMFCLVRISVKNEWVVRLLWGGVKSDFWMNKI